MQYKIEKGDTLGEIATRFGQTLANLAALNKIKNPNKIRAGATLTIPVPGEEAAPSPPPPPVEEIGRIEPYSYEAPPEPIDVEIMPSAEFERISNQVQMPVAEVIEKPEPGAYDMIAKVLQQAHLYTDPVRVLSGNAGNPAPPSPMDYINTAMMGLATPHGRIGPPTVMNEPAMMKYSELINRRPSSMGGGPENVITSMERPQYGRPIGMQQPPKPAPTPNFAPRMQPIGDPLAGHMGRLPLSVRAKEFPLPTEISASRNYTPVGNAFVNTVPWSPVR